MAVMVTESSGCTVAGVVTAMRGAAASTAELRSKSVQREDIEAYRACRHWRGDETSIILSTALS
jgi:ABC-type transporter Mla maintaining outer membrane lipid asymmetry permease subunit MlaE